MSWNVVDNIQQNPTLFKSNFNICIFSGLINYHPVLFCFVLLLLLLLLLLLQYMPLNLKCKASLYCRWICDSVNPMLLHRKSNKENAFRGLITEIGAFLKKIYHHGNFF